ncbi:beta-galactosidase [Hamadaea tsunoensis]|uniref:beta-galactosidase n=1 Tax=Hamadaea tsunoensis TaxID=53368 RepID=UPI000487F1A4|nr:beta-galactosidase [Hamadaea tsunoensis]
MNTADYPYYRDDAEVWADRLRALRDDLGITVVTCYIPWRHHQPVAGEAPDFTGQTHPSRNVVGFLELCQAAGLTVIAKPGPFIHAETTYGGLPDWVGPIADERIEPLLDSAGQPSRWGWDLPEHPSGRPLPAPFGAVFSAYTREWLDAVGRQVLDGRLFPEGPVAMIQIANEGIYTNGAREVTAFDYSPSGLAFYRECLAEWYGSVDAYNLRHGTGFGSWSDVDGPRAWDAKHPLVYADWGRFHDAYLGRVYRMWTDWVGVDVPTVVNLNPPTIKELDDWLARVRPAGWDRIDYGFTNWMGVVSTDLDAHARYVIAAKLAPGPNMEENWGFSELYDRAYADAATSHHQTLLALAAGATGFNVYTGVGTSGWLRELDDQHTEPYPDCSPIAEDGSATVKAPVVKALADFFARHGDEFLACVPETGGAFGLYRPYAGIAAWSADPDVPQCGRVLRAYHERMRSAGLDYTLVDLEAATADELAAVEHLTVPGGNFMAEDVQRKLAAYATAGGLLTIEGPLPETDEQLRPCALLAGIPLVAGPTAEPGARVVAGHADVYRRTGEGGVAYLTVLAQSDNDGPVRIAVEGEELAFTLARGGAAIVRLVDGALDDVIVKGTNSFLDSAEVAAVTHRGTMISATGPGDLVIIGGLPG